MLETTDLREFSVGELVADRAVHVAGLTLGVAGAVALTALSAIAVPWGALATVVAYSTGLLAMLSFSAAYNLCRESRHRHILRRLDHAAIFAMIAGTYTPFTVLGLEGGWRIGMTVAVWLLAAIGIGVKLLAPTQKSTRLSAVLYLGFGWMGLVAVGGALYSVGVVFHALQRMPYQNAIWHAFVLAAAAVHFAAVSGIVAEAR